MIAHEIGLILSTRSGVGLQRNVGRVTRLGRYDLGQKAKRCPCCMLETRLRHATIGIQASRPRASVPLRERAVRDIEHACRYVLPSLLS
jgi:hypothetical protein